MEPYEINIGVTYTANRWKGDRKVTNVLLRGRMGSSKSFPVWIVKLSSWKIVQEDLSGQLGQFQWVGSDETLAADQRADVEMVHANGQWTIAWMDNSPDIDATIERHALLRNI